MYFLLSIKKRRFEGRATHFRSVTKKPAGAMRTSRLFLSGCALTKYIQGGELYNTAPLPLFASKKAVIIINTEVLFVPDRERM